MGIRTVGYIVADSLGRALVLNERTGRFYYFGGKTATLYGMGDYERARSDLRAHYREMNETIERNGLLEINKPFLTLKIVSLRFA